MKIRYTVRSLLVLLLFAAMALGFCPAAHADTITLYPDDQYYVYDKNETHVFAVQVAAMSNYQNAVKMRTKMLDAGYDSFLYEYEGKFRIMCGKFRDKHEALVYQQSIHVHTDRVDAYVTNAYLPEDAIQAFEAVYSQNAVILNAYDTYWEVPTGPYFRSDAANTIQVFTVQFSAGTNFSAAELSRDRMTEQGFPSFVYKLDLEYRIMSGLFYTRQEAQEYRDQLLANSSRSAAFVNTVKVPASAVDTFRDYGYIETVNPVYLPPEERPDGGGTQVIGTWDESDQPLLIGWQYIGGRWYYYDSQGVMKTGWVKSGGDWYYLDSSGAMLTKAIFSDGSGIYAVDENGVMVTNRTIVDKDGFTYHFGADGRCDSSMHP